jgi:hypothetical protein
MTQRVGTWSLISGASVITDVTYCRNRGVISDHNMTPLSKADGTCHWAMMKPESTPDSSNSEESTDLM